MDKGNNDSDLETNPDVDDNQSLVGKLKKNVSEIISNTSLSKWFHKRKEENTPTVRRREDDSDDEDWQEIQPPAKRTKMPSSKEALCLNVSEALSPISANNTRKPLPSRTFPEPIPGPSGYQTRKIVNSTTIFSEGNRSMKFTDPKSTFNSSEVTNKEGHSDSEESTSGYSSGRVGSKEVVSQESSKQASPTESSPRKIRSLFQTSGLFTSERSSSPNTSLSSRAPSFNPSTFGTSSFEDRTLASKRILNSPFYSGRTIYGGASAYGRLVRRTPQEIQKVLRKSVSIKPTNVNRETGNAQLGKTARRILDTLQQYSSPISDAKKIPLTSKRQRIEGNLTKYIGANPYTVRGAATKELQVPSVAESSRSKQKSKLQDSTETVRQIATSFAKDSYQIPVQKETGKQVTKMKSKITSVRHKVHIEETVPEVNLPSISLPIKELPRFDIVMSPPKSATSQEQALVTPIVKTPETKVQPIPCIVEAKSDELTNSYSHSEFKFSAPLVLAQYVKPLKALNNFKFSEPLIKKRRSIHSELDEEQVKAADGVKVKKNNGENFFKSVKSADSVMDKFKPKEGTWECSVCLIRNQSHQNRCAACETPKATSRISNDPKPSLVAPISFKPPEGSWECPTCMIRNKDSLQKCAACEELKPDKTNVKKVPQVILDTAFQSPLKNPESGPASNVFKPFNPRDRWTCSTCLITNKEELTKCAACETSRQTSTNQSSNSTFSTALKKPEDKWECPVCMVRNSSEADKCVCCETPNPNKSSSNAMPKESTAKVSSFNFGIDKATASSFTFGIPADVKQTSGISNASSVFGEKKTESNGAVGSFVFGIPAKTETASPKESPKTETGSVFKVEVAPVKSDAKTTPASTSTLSNATTTAPSSTSFAFGVKPAVSDGKSMFSEKSAETATPPAIPSFQFGVPKKSEKEVVKPPEYERPKTARGFVPDLNATSSLTTATPTFGTGFGKNPDEKKESVNPLLKPEEKLPEKAVVAPTGFSFGLAKAPSSTSILPSVGNLPTNQAASEQSPTKRSKPTDSDAPPSAKLPMFSFKQPLPVVTNGNVSNATSLFAPKPATGESSKPPAGGFNFNFSANKSSVPAPAASFGSGATKVDSSKSSGPTFKFESSLESTNKSNGISFGSTVPSSGDKFGSNPAPSDFSFGGAKPFTFSAPQSTERAFSTNFGASAAPASTQGSTFGFNQPTFSSTTTQQKPAGGFGAPAANLFGGANNNNNNSQSQQTPAVFGTTNSGPSAAQPNGMFNFGSAAGTNKAGFSFGASKESAAFGGFSFGSSVANPSSSSSGGFNFSGSMSSFDVNTKPAFNFTGSTGIPAFSAPPLQDNGPMPQRKIKKAIRRTAR